MSVGANSWMLENGSRRLRSVIKLMVSITVFELEKAKVKPQADPMKAFTTNRKVLVATRKLLHSKANG